MATYPWILTALVLAAAPIGCVVTLGGPDGSGGFGGNGAGGGNGNGGSAPSGDQCNPVTGNGCASDGSTCDLGPTGYFACFPPPNSVDVCGACDGVTAFCGSDLTCVLPNGSGDGACYRYCCTDADCGAGGTCDTNFGAIVLQPASSKDAVGLCVTSSTDQGPACGPPATSPSGGACIGGFSGGADGGTADAAPESDGGGGEGDASAPDDGGGAADAGSPFGDGGHGGRHDGGSGQGP